MALDVSFAMESITLKVWEMGQYCLVLADDGFYTSFVWHFMCHLYQVAGGLTYDLLHLKRTLYHWGIEAVQIQIRWH